jgi:pimeloyl-ACP methyl ester carboxylesterase
VTAAVAACYLSGSSASHIGWRFHFRQRADRKRCPGDEIMDISLREHWFEHEGIRLFAAEAGQGTPVVLLHGGLANHLACWQFAPALAARHRVITPDLRGAGRSHFGAPLSWDLLAGDIPALLRSLGIARAVIGGISFGAGVAVRVALRHPEVVSALLVLHPAYGGAALGLSPLQQTAMAAMHAAGSRVVAEGLEVLLPLFDALPPDVRERARRVASTYDPASVATTTALMASGAQPFGYGDELAAITAPTLLVPGVDPYHPPEVAAVFRRHLRDCTVREAALSELGGVIGDWLQNAPA